MKTSLFFRAVYRSDFLQNLHFSVSTQAHLQLSHLQGCVVNRPVINGSDPWSYIWGNAILSTSGAYKALIGSRSVHPPFVWIWKSKCQMTHKVFFLLLKDRLSTMDLVQRKHVVLESYTCDLCILYIYFCSVILPRHAVSQLE
jgi:hypothetical protein